MLEVDAGRRGDEEGDEDEEDEEDEDEDFDLSSRDSNVASLSDIATKGPCRMRRRADGCRAKMSMRSGGSTWTQCSLKPAAAAFSTAVL